MHRHPLPHTHTHMHTHTHARTLTRFVQGSVRRLAEDKAALLSRIEESEQQTVIPARPVLVSTPPPMPFADSVLPVRPPLPGEDGTRPATDRMVASLSVTVQQLEREREQLLRVLQEARHDRAELQHELSLARASPARAQTHTPSRRWDEDEESSAVGESLQALSDGHDVSTHGRSGDAVGSESPAPSSPTTRRALVQPDSPVSDTDRHAHSASHLRAHGSAEDAEAMQLLQHENAQLRRTVDDQTAELVHIRDERTALRQRIKLEEHLTTQLAQETETIGEYVTLYQSQRLAMSTRLQEKEEDIQRLLAEARVLQQRLSQAMASTASETADFPDTSSRVHLLTAPGSSLIGLEGQADSRNARFGKVDASSQRLAWYETCGCPRCAGVIRTL